jgi:hypothetical protein
LWAIAGRRIKPLKSKCPNHGILNVIPFNDGQENARHCSSGWEGGVIASRRAVGFARSRIINGRQQKFIL